MIEIFCFIITHPLTLARIVGELGAELLGYLFRREMERLGSPHLPLIERLEKHGLRLSKNDSPKGKGRNQQEPRR